ncbi:sensor histidine kinase [Yinghuangia soli]|uniref:histidine kinase n=1 Tax=Yinghuangia soli TaxID=2908204 RepID=A0AA41Q6J6_9ACTN|nr:histidine kinase [Yinghuangia soli]MCF2531621.1 histidine kinase [Yinghuangia soli]
MTPAPHALTPPQPAGRLAAFLRRPGPLGGDALLALAATLVALVLLYGNATQADAPMQVGFVDGRPVAFLPEETGPDSWTVILAMLTTIALAWRRSSPILVFGVQLGAVLVVDEENVAIPIIAALAAGAYTVAAHVPRARTALAVLGAGTVALVAKFPDDDNSPPGVTVLAVMAAMWAAGRTIGTWRTRAGALHGRAVKAEYEREVAVALERARIARELHDVVSHNVSVMVIQSGAARMVLRTDPDAATEALRAVETSGRETMAELRYMLDVLTAQDGGGGAGEGGGAPAAEAGGSRPGTTGSGPRSGSGAGSPASGQPGTGATGRGVPDGDALGPPLAPQPDLARLPVLVDRVRTAGLDVRLDTGAGFGPLPPGVELTAYRVVQEALTNALKYAPGSRTDVTLTHDPGSLRIEVADRGPAEGRRPEPLGAGRGLLGLAERVHLHNGTFRSGHRPTGGYRVEATIPVPAP